MRIAVVSTYPPKECGIGIYTKNLVEPMLKNGILVEVITFKGSNYEADYVKAILEKNKLSTYIMGFNYIRKAGFDRILIQHEYTFYNVLYFQIFLILLWLASKKVNVTMHTVPSYDGFVKKSIFTIVNTGIAMFSTQIILHTKYAKDILLHNTLVRKSIKIVPIPVKSMGENRNIPFSRRIIHNPLNPKKENRSRTVNILCFGFIAYEKGMEIACKALGGVKNIRLNIIGSFHPSAKKKHFRYYNQIRHFAERYDNIFLSNRFISEDEKIQAFIDNDFILLPYRLITQSAVLTEAWSLGRIPICSDIPAFKEEIGNDKYGILFQSNNPDELRRNALRLIKDTKLQRKILENILNIRKERSFDRVSKRLLNTLV